MDGFAGIESKLQMGNQLLAQIDQTLKGITRLSTGSFTLAAAATTTVTDTNVTANSVVLPFPTNASAATLMAGASSLYVSAKTAGTSFTVATADGGNAAGTETFEYLIYSPV